MDKRTVYGSICGSKNDRICLAQCWDDPEGYCPGGCEEYILIRPTELAKEAEDARIGRATIALRDKWRDRIKSDEPTTRHEEAMWRELVATIAEAIAKAKEGEGCG